MNSFGTRWLPFLVVGAVAIPAAGGLSLLGLSSGWGIGPALGGGILAGLGLGAGIWALLDATVMKAVRRLAIEVAAAAHGAARPAIDPGHYPFLPVLPQAMLSLASKLAQSRHETDALVRAKTAELALERARLAAVIDGLHEGVVVCNARHQVVLYNAAARVLLDGGAGLGLGRPLHALIAPDPLEHAFDVLRRRGGGGAHVPFVAGTRDGRLILQGLMGAVGGEDGAGLSGYVVTLADWGRMRAALAGRDSLLATLIEGVEAALPALADETARQTLGALAGWARESRAALQGGWWPMADIFSADLFDLVRRRLERKPGGPDLAVIGLPVWLQGDGHALALVIEGLVLLGFRAGCAETFDLSAERTGAGVRIALSWQGEAMAQEALGQWWRSPLDGAALAMTPEETLANHGVPRLDLHETDGERTLAMMLPAASDALGRPSAQAMPARPDFFDFDLLAQAPAGRMGATALARLDYVVFDVETTGLSLKGGDKVVALAGVRIVNGRILTGEVFERLVNPGRPIPPEASRVHGLTDEMVADKPPLAVVLRQFHAFVEGAVLVAHNAAFDLGFIRQGEAEAGVAFDNPTLDTMLLSAFVDGSVGAQSLDEIARRYGIVIADRHSARGDALATAAVLLALREPLAAKGIVTLDQALDGLNMTMAIHDRMLAQR